MIKKKNKPFTFIFSLMPGAGQMYMGFMKRGLSLMTSFIIVIFLSTWLNIGPLMLIALIVWFYSFFDTHNLRSTPDDEFYELEDDYIILNDFLEDVSQKQLFKEYIHIFSGALIIIGFTILWNNFHSIFRDLLPSFVNMFFYNFSRYLPQLVIGFAIIYLGIYLIRGKKQELDEEPDIDINSDEDINEDISEYESLDEDIDEDIDKDEVLDEDIGENEDIDEGKGEAQNENS